MAITKNVLKQIFSDIATAHYQVHSFGWGDFLDLEKQWETSGVTQSLESVRQYPILWVQPAPSTITGKTLNYTFDILVADLVRKGEENRIEVESDTDQIIQDVIALLDDKYYGFQLDRASISIDPFTQRFTDELTGHVATVTLKVAYTYNRCQVPASFIAATDPYLPLDNGSNEQDPIFTAHPAYGITQADIDNWDSDTGAVWGSITGTLTNQVDLRNALNAKLAIVDAEVTYVHLSGNETIAGIKSFSSAPIITPLTSALVYVDANGQTQEAVVTSANGLSLTGNTLAMAAASDVQAGAVTTGAQTFAGAKTFNNAPILNAFTLGSALFIGAGGAVAQDNANFFWDDTNNRLGIGTNAPSSKLHVAGGSINLDNDQAMAWGGGTERPAIVGNKASGYLTFFITGIERARITSSGSLLVGSSTDNARVYVVGPSNGVAFRVDEDGGTSYVQMREVAGVKQVGWFNATPVAQQTISGSRGGNAALADLLTKLALAGLIIDGTSA